jgi:hypothetical protein
MAKSKYPMRGFLSVLVAGGLVLGLAAPAQARLAANKIAINGIGANAAAAGLGAGAASDIVAVQLADGTKLTR